MPTVLLVRGWRVFFYADEGNEPIHVHAKKGDAECKLWLDTELLDVEEAWAYAMTPRLRREIRQIVFDHFDVIVEEWNNRFGDRGRADNSIITAVEIETTEEELVVRLADREVRIPWRGARQSLPLQPPSSAAGRNCRPAVMGSVGRCLTRIFRSVV